MKPHKHAELIKAWADGAEIQLKGRNGEWIDIFPDWQEECEYRIKHEPKPEPEKQWMYIYCNAQESKTWISPIGPGYYKNVRDWTYMGKFEVQQ